MQLITILKNRKWMNNELIVAWKKSIHLISVDYLFVGKILSIHK